MLFSLTHTIKTYVDKLRRICIYDKNVRWRSMSHLHIKQKRTLTYYVQLNIRLKRTCLYYMRNAYSVSTYVFGVCRRWE